MSKLYNDVRGLRDFVVAKGTTDNGTSYVTEMWHTLEGAISADTSYEESFEARYRDNKVIGGLSSEGPDTCVFNMDVLEHEIKAYIENRTYIATNKIYGKTPKTGNPWYAFGYIKKLTDGTEVAVIMYKTTITSSGSDSAATEDSGTEVKTKEYTANGVYTNTKFATAAGTTSWKTLEVPLSTAVTEAKLFGVFTNGVSTLGAQTPDVIEDFVA